MNWNWLFGKFEMHWGLTLDDMAVIENTCQQNSAVLERVEIQLTGPCLPGIN